MSDALVALRSSVDRLGALVGRLDDSVIDGRAYPAEWTIAQVLSHIGSGAAIFRRGLEDALSGTESPADFNQQVWDEWNAKSPREQVDDAVVADEALTAALEAVTPEQQAGYRRSLGPIELDFAGDVGLRLNEHLLHEWDVAVAVDPSATLGADGVEVVIDNLELIGRFTAKPTGDSRTITVATTDPERHFAVTLEPDAVAFAAVKSVVDPDLTLPAEQFIRLVYGRVDPVEGEPEALTTLRAVFPGP